MRDVNDISDDQQQMMNDIEQIEEDDRGIMQLPQGIHAHTQMMSG